MQHIIRKQTIQLSLTNQQEAFRTQQLVSGHYWHDVLPVLEKLFNEVSTENETLYLDTLEIDLGILTEKEIARQNFSPETLTLIAKQLREKLIKFSAGPKQKGKLHATSVGIGRQWLFYMEKGYLPWNTLQINEVWKQQVLKALSTDIGSVAALRILISANANAVTRIVARHTPSFLIKLIEILTGSRQPDLSQLLNELEILYHALLKTNSGMQALPKSKIREIFWRNILEISAASERNFKVPVWVHGILEQYFDGLKKQPIPHTTITSNLPALVPIIRLWEQKTNANGHQASAESIKEITDNQEDQDVIPDEQPKLEEEGIFVQHAGVVLLHPFLSTFFSRSRLTKAGKFINLKTQQKALYLLHYLCTGTFQAEEHELVIPKVLCGYPLQKPVHKQARLTKADKEESEHVLEELIRQWEMLKNTSSAGLREGFLQRQGKLQNKNDMLYIQVEAKSIDILLDHLPWNLSIIKLPWMKHLIRVEWR